MFIPPWRPWHNGRGLYRGFPQIRQSKLGVDHVYVGGGVYAVGYVDHVVVIKAAHHMGNRVGFADVGEEFIAQALTLGGTCNQACNIHKPMVMARMRSGFTMAAGRPGAGRARPLRRSWVRWCKGGVLGAYARLVKALNRVDLPTLGRPTMPHLKTHELL